MKEILLFILLCLLTLSGYSQDKQIFYVDETYKEINEGKFEGKINSSFFVIATTTNDSAVFKKVRFREYFGKLNLIKKHQLNKLLYNKHNIDSTKILLIHYNDSLPDLKKFYKKTGIILLDSLGRDYGYVMDLGEFNRKHVQRLRKEAKEFLKSFRHVRSFANFKEIAKKEKKEFSRIKDIEFFHFYNFNKNYPVEYDEFNWVQDTNLIFQKIFTDGNKMYKNLIIYPNGDFYVHTGRAPLWKQKKLLKRRHYNKLKKEWLKEYNKLD